MTLEDNGFELGICKTDFFLSSPGPDPSLFFSIAVPVNFFRQSRSRLTFFPSPGPGPSLVFSSVPIPVLDDPHFIFFNSTDFFKDLYTFNDTRRIDTGNFDSLTARAFFYIQLSEPYIFKWHGFSMRQTFLISIIWLRNFSGFLILLCLQYRYKSS
jgi:hypothetical protein